jgi:hypothetical protein
MPQENKSKDTSSGASFFTQTQTAAERGSLRPNNRQQHKRSRHIAAHLC